MDKKRPNMPGGLTKEEFAGLRDDLKQLISDHPRSRFTIVFLDKDGNRTEDPSLAAKYGLTVHEDEALLYEEFGDLVDGKAVPK